MAILDQDKSVKVVTEKWIDEEEEEKGYHPRNCILRNLGVQTRTKKQDFGASDKRNQRTL